MSIPGAEQPQTDQITHAPLRWSWREWSAVAAALVVGVMFGPYVLRSSLPLPFVSEGGRIVAIGVLDAALMTQRSGEAGKDTAGTTIGMTFRTPSGQYCRTFATNRGPAGLACRERGDWVVEVLARNPRPRDGSAPAGYRQAGLPFPDLIRRAVEARITGTALTAAEEARGAQAKWRAERVLKDASP
jgi:hypothetical protein